MQLVAFLQYLGRLAAAISLRGGLLDVIFPIIKLLLYFEI
jgi:hypothetical protein